MQGNIHERGLKQSVDWTLVLYYVLLVLIGWVNIYASIQSAGPTSIFDFDCPPWRWPGSSCLSFRPGSGNGRHCPFTGW